jgi:hypothetical protein
MGEDELLKELIGRWRGALLSIPSGVSDASLGAFEHRFGLRLPQSFRAYLRLVNGMVDGDWAADLVHFWSLDEIERYFGDPAKVRRYPFVPFADCSTNCWAWVLPIESSGSVQDAVFTYGPPLDSCAPSFRSFMAKCLGGDDLSQKARPSSVPPLAVDAVAVCPRGVYRVTVGPRKSGLLTRRPPRRRGPPRVPGLAGAGRSGMQPALRVAVPDRIR